MCLGIPAKVLDKYQKDDLCYGRVQIGGISKEVCLEYTKNVLPEEYVLVHVGFALSIINEAEVEKLYELFSELNDLDQMSGSE